MDDADPVTREQQLADLAELKQATRRRHGFDRGTPEWEAAIEVERRAVDQVRSWAHPSPPGPPARRRPGPLSFGSAAYRAPGRREKGTHSDE